MAKITVHLLNFHGIASHIEVVLENKLTNEFYRINICTAKEPSDAWKSASSGLNENYIKQASAIFSFTIEADPAEITQAWMTYWQENYQTASVWSNNCADTTQWFLSKFAGIPKPDLSNVSLNYLAGLIWWPSLIPCPITLPGRIMSNAKFHIDVKEHSELAAKYSNLFLNISMAIAVCLLEVSVFSLAMAAFILTGGIATAAIVACVAVAAASTYGFFKAANISSKKFILNANQAEVGETDQENKVPSLGICAQT